MNKLYRFSYNSPIGDLLLKANQSELISIEFIDSQISNEKVNEILERSILQLNEYFCGERLTFDLPIKFNGTDFQNKVWKALEEILYGQCISYKSIAEKIDHPKAYRAVGNANNKNKLPIIIPCHRVVGSNNQLTGYAGGIWRKKWLLEHEAKILERNENDRKRKNAIR